MKIQRFSAACWTEKTLSYCQGIFANEVESQAGRISLSKLKVFCLHRSLLEVGEVCRVLCYSEHTSTLTMWHVLLVNCAACSWHSVSLQCRSALMLPWTVLRWSYFICLAILMHWKWLEVRDFFQILISSSLQFVKICCFYCTNIQENLTSHAN